MGKATKAVLYRLLNDEMNIAMVDDRSLIGTSKADKFAIRFYKLADGKYEVDQCLDGKLLRVYDDIPKEDLIDIFGSSFPIEHIRW